MKQRVMHDLFDGLRYVANMHQIAFNNAHPRASKWTDVWAEVRHSCGPLFPAGTEYRSAVVVCEFNRRNGKTKDKTLLAGTGNTPQQTMVDLVTQLRAHFPDVYAVERAPGGIQINGPVGDKCYPTGFLGATVVGVS